MSKRINTKKTTVKTVSTEKKDAVEKTEVVSKVESKKKAEEPKAELKKKAEEPKAESKEKVAKPKEEPKKKAEEPKEESKEKAEEPKVEEKEKADEPKAEEKKKAEEPKAEEKKKAEEPKAEEKKKAGKPKAEPKEKADKLKAEPKKKAEEPKAEPKKKVAKSKTVTRKRAVRPKTVTEEKAVEPKTTAKKKTVRSKAATKEEAVATKEKVVAAKEKVVAPKTTVEQNIPMEQPDLGPRRSVAFIGSECYPFVKTGGLGDVMSALPKALAKLNLDVKVILPRYKCIPQEYQEKMEYRGSFYMNLCSDGKQYYVGIMEYQEDGVVYDFIDNYEFFSWGNPYTNLIDDIPKFCYFAKASLAALNYLDWTPDVVHCHDWQAALVPLYLRTSFSDTDVGRAIAVLTIHNLRFQGVYDRKMIQYWSGLPDYVFNKDCLTQNWLDANMLKGGIDYCNKVTTVSNTYAEEIQTEEYGEGLAEHLRYHQNKILGIVNGIDTDIWDPATDKLLASNYDAGSVIKNKKVNKKALQEALGLDVDENKMVIGLISRLTNQKGLDLVNDVIPGIMDGNTQVVVLGTGDSQYEDTFRYYENKYKGSFCAYIAYNENVAHNIYAGCDALLVPSRFEPCGLTQLISMRYGAVPIVRETGGLKDTVQPYNVFENTGNGFTFDRYESGLLYDAINRAKTLYFENRKYWDDMVIRDMNKDVSWEKSAKQYKDMYVGLTPRY